MSVFSKIKMSKRAAQQHKEKTTAEQNQQKKAEEEVAKVPYKHIPTHAAVDALSGAPSSWKTEDRPKIREHHKRRSQMTLTRTNSAISSMSYMCATPGSNPQIPPLPRNSSYSSYNPTWNNRGDINYLSEPIPARQTRTKPSKGHSYCDSGIGPSPLASKAQSEASSPVGSSGNSTSSSDNLEIMGAKSSPKMYHRESYKPQPMVFEEKDIFASLHKSTSRKLGEAPSSPSNALPPVPKLPTPAMAAQEPKQQPKKWSTWGKRREEPIAV